ncbi:UNVERIFIED_CONTAM: hypothetical protein K2H54_027518 [Gekko kuhli]
MVDYTELGLEQIVVVINCRINASPQDLSNAGLIVPVFTLPICRWFKLANRKQDKKAKKPISPNAHEEMNQPMQISAEEAGMGSLTNLAWEDILDYSYEVMFSI